MQHTIYKKIIENTQANIPQLAVLIDPDKLNLKQLDITLQHATQAQVNFFFVGGSLLLHHHTNTCIQHIRNNSNIPVVLFPGSPLQISPFAHAILFLSLISGRNPELLIGHHVVSAPLLKELQLEVIPTGYMLIDGGSPTSVSYMSNTTPIPHNKPAIAACTAMAGEMLGLKLLYLDAGSGAQNCVHPEMIQQVKLNTQLPIIVGGGIRTPQQAREAWQAGANVVVIGNATENNPHIILQIAEQKQQLQR